jgi:hypothetical protein
MIVISGIMLQNLAARHHQEQKCVNVTDESGVHE